MRTELVIIAALLLGGCAELSKYKVGDDGMYRFKKYPFAVMAPQACVPDMFVEEEDRSVDFVTGRGYWEISGKYAVQIYDLPDDIKSDTDFAARTETFFKSYMERDREYFGLEFVVTDLKRSDVNGYIGFQAISGESKQAALVATSVKYPTHIVVASLLYPLNENRPIVDQIPWTCYNKFVSSVRVVQ